MVGLDTVAVWRGTKGMNMEPDNSSSGEVSRAQGSDIAKGRAIEQIVAALTSLGEPQSGVEIKRVYAEAERLVDNRANWVRVRGVGQQEQNVMNEMSARRHATSEPTESFETWARREMDRTRVGLSDRLERLEQSLMDFRNDVKTADDAHGLSVDCDLKIAVEYKIVCGASLTLEFLELLGRDGWKPGLSNTEKTIFWREVHVRQSNFIRQRDLPNPKATF